MDDKTPHYPEAKVSERVPDRLGGANEAEKAQIGLQLNIMINIVWGQWPKGNEVGVEIIVGNAYYKPKRRYT
jgi:hypothetical protein